MTFTPLRLFSQEKSQSIRAQFPILEQSVNNEPLIYFDNAATSQTPHSVVEALADYYHYDNANIHRGVHTLAEQATRAYEGSRQYIADSNCGSGCLTDNTIVKPSRVSSPDKLSSESFSKLFERA